MRSRTIAGSVLVAAMAALPVGAAAAATPYTQTSLSIPMTDAEGQPHRLVGKLCVPSNAVGKSRLVLINHGSPAVPSDRPKMAIGSCDSEPAQWFLSRGFAVVYALRRGYGATGGAWAENYGHCDNPDYVKAGLESARDVSAVINYTTRLPQILPNGAVVAGVSAGGWATDAYNSLPHPKVIAMISMAGGRGGHRNDVPNNNCTPEALAQAASVFGKTATTPMLWVYAQNDTFFRPEIAGAMYAAFTEGGGKVEFHAVGPSGNEGLYLWSANGGSAVWGPLVEKYLQSRGALPPVVQAPPVRTAALPHPAGQATPTPQTHGALALTAPTVPVHAATAPNAIVQPVPTPKPHSVLASAAPILPVPKPNMAVQSAAIPQTHRALASTAPIAPVRIPAAATAQPAPRPQSHSALASTMPAPTARTNEAAEIAREARDALASLAPIPPARTPIVPPPATMQTAPSPDRHTSLASAAPTVPIQTPTAPHVTAQHIAAPEPHNTLASAAPTAPTRTPTVPEVTSQSVPKPEPQNTLASNESTQPARTSIGPNATVRDASLSDSRSALVPAAQPRLVRAVETPGSSQDAAAQALVGRTLNKGDDTDDDNGIDVVKH
jgi:dienelactone hydrolase